MTTPPLVTFSRNHRAPTSETIVTHLRRHHHLHPIERAPDEPSIDRERASGTCMPHVTRLGPTGSRKIAGREARSREQLLQAGEASEEGKRGSEQSACRLAPREVSARRVAMSEEKPKVSWGRPRSSLRCLDSPPCGGPGLSGVRGRAIPSKGLLGFCAAAAAFSAFKKRRVGLLLKGKPSSLPVLGPRMSVPRPGCERETGPASPGRKALPRGGSPTLFLPGAPARIERVFRPQPRVSL